MNKLFTGSLNVSQIIELAKKNHKAFYKSEKTGDMYLNVAVWVNKEKDKFGNDISFQVITEKEEKNIYIGNAKEKPNDGTKKNSAGNANAQRKDGFLEDNGLDIFDLYTKVG